MGDWRSQILKVKIGIQLLQANAILASPDPNLAKALIAAHHASKLAHLLRIKSLVGRCAYSLHEAALRLGDYEGAMLSLEPARACEGLYPEGEELVQKYRKARGFRRQMEKEVERFERELVEKRQEMNEGSQDTEATNQEARWRALEKKQRQLEERQRKLREWLPYVDESQHTEDWGISQHDIDYSDGTTSGAHMVSWRRERAALFLRKRWEIVFDDGTEADVFLKKLQQEEELACKDGRGPGTESGHEMLNDKVEAQQSVEQSQTTDESSAAQPKKTLYLGDWSPSNPGSSVPDAGPLSNIPRSPSPTPSPELAPSQAEGRPGELASVHSDSSQSQPGPLLSVAASIERSDRSGYANTLQKRFSSHSRIASESSPEETHATVTRGHHRAKSSPATLPITSDKAPSENGLDWQGASPAPSSSTSNDTMPRDRKHELPEFHLQWRCSTPHEPDVAADALYSTPDPWPVEYPQGDDGNISPFESSLSFSTPPPHPGIDITAAHASEAVHDSEYGTPIEPSHPTYQDTDLASSPPPPSPVLEPQDLAPSFESPQGTSSFDKAETEPLPVLSDAYFGEPFDLEAQARIDLSTGELSPAPLHTAREFGLFPEFPASEERSPESPDGGTTPEIYQPIPRRARATSIYRLESRASGVRIGLFACVDIWY